MGSIFADNLREERVEGVLPLVASQGGETAEREPAARVTEALAMRELREVAAIEQPHESRSEATEPQRYVPLVPGRVVEPAAADAEVAGLLMPEASLDRTRQPYRQPEGTKRKEESEGGTLPLETRAISQPLVLKERSEEQSVEASVEPVPMREPMRTAPTRAERRESQERVAAAGTPERDATEEIQIHIGRIEVIAVPPPAARAAPAPTRKFTTLDDYLKRRDGRAR